MSNLNSPRRDSDSSNSDNDQPGHLRSFGRNQMLKLRKAGNHLYKPLFDTKSKVTEMVSQNLPLIRFTDPDLELISVLGTHGDCITSICSRESFCLSGSLDRTVKLWNLETNQEIYIFGDHKGAVNSVDIHPSDTLCVSGSGDKSVRVWNFENDSTQIYWHESPVRSVNFHDSKILSVSEIGDLILFNLDGTATETHNLTSRRVSCCEASPSSRNIVAVGSFYGLVSTFDLRCEEKKCRPILTLSDGHGRRINSVKFTERDDQLVTSSNDKNIRIWDLRNGRLINKIQVADGVNQIQYDKDKRTILATMDTSKFGIIDLKRETTKISRFSVSKSKSEACTINSGSILIGGWARELASFKYPEL